MPVGGVRRSPVHLYAYIILYITGCFFTFVVTICLRLLPPPPSIVEGPLRVMFMAVRRNTRLLQIAVTNGEHKSLE